MIFSCNTPGKLLFTADTLSRAVDLSTPPKPDETMEDDIDVYVDIIMTSLPVSTATTEKIRDETAKDPVLTKLTKTILEGWPERRINAHLNQKISGTTEMNSQW